MVIYVTEYFVVVKKDKEDVLTEDSVKSYDSVFGMSKLSEKGKVFRYVYIYVMCT